VSVRPLLAALALLAVPPAAAGQLEPTPAELSGYRETPSYEETLAFLRSLGERLPELRLEEFGRTGEGRPMTVAILSRQGAFTPAAAQALGRPVVLIQNGIHAGEIDGKDAFLALLRDFAAGRRRELLDAATLLVVPVYNVDGHERVSPWNRPNQNGPERGMGYRANAAGYDLNRDFTRLDTPEARALVGLVNRWQPHLHVDVHVTNGADFAWVQTWIAAGAPLLAAPLDGWQRAAMPRIFAAVAAAGYPNGPYVDLIDRLDPARGIDSRVFEPRYSTGYFPRRNIASILIENHAHTDYRTRVEATLAFFVALLEDLRASGRELVAAASATRNATEEKGRPGAEPSEVVVTWRAGEEDRIRVPFRPWRVVESAATGSPYLSFSAEGIAALDVPWLHRVAPDLVRARPRGYVLLAGWPEVEARLAAHGLRFTRLESPVELELEVARAVAPQFATPPFQGRTRVTAEFRWERHRRRVPAGSLWIPADQPDFELAVQLLEPEAADSLFSWGLMSTALERREYIGPDRLDAEARRLLADPGVRAEWEHARADPALAGDPVARYQWWYRRTPYWHDFVGELPVGRLLSPLPGEGSERGAGQPAAP
jgi:hypothetical protein